MTLVDLAPVSDGMSDVPLSPGGTVALDSVNGLVSIVGGRIEIYGQVGETRCFLAEMPDGATLVGGGPRGLVGLAPEGARLVPARATQSGDLAEFLDRWIWALCAGLARYAPVRPELAVLRHGEGRMLASGEAVTSGRSVAWVSVDGQEVRFLDRLAVRSTLLPLTPATWITATAPCRAEARATSDVVTNGAWRDGVHHFHSVIAGVLEDRLASDREGELRRVVEREGVVQADLASANERLVGVLRGRSRRRIEHADDIHYVLDLVAGARTAPPGGEGSNLREALDRRGIRGRAVDLKGAWWRNDCGRLIGFMDPEATPVALLPDWRGRYRIHRRGHRPVSAKAETVKALGARGITVAMPLPDRRLTLSDFGAVSRSICFPEIVTIAVATLGAALTGLLLPLAIEAVIDTFIPNKLRDGVLMLGVALVMLNVCSSLLRLVADLARLRMDAKLSVALQGGLIERVLRLPSRFLHTQASADLTTRVMAIDQLRRLLTGVLMGPATSGAFALTSFALLFYYSVPAAIAALLLFVVFIAIAIASGRGQLRALTTGEAISVNLAAFTLHIIQNVSVLRAFAAERRAFSRWAQTTAVMRSRTLRARFASIGFETFIACYDGLALATVFLILGVTSTGGRLSTGDYLAFVAAYQGFLFSIQGLGRALIQVQGARPAVSRTRELLAEMPETTAWAQDPGPLRGEIEVSSVSFAYEPQAPAVLDDVSIRIEPGKFVALAGPSGCGKSTLLSLILGFHQPTSGAVLYDGRDLSKLNKAAVRQQIGVVRQGGKLIGGSIFENIIGLFDGTVDDAWAAADAAGIAADIRQLPMGMHTILSEGLPTFSGGQIQRLLIARALVGKPRILLLDEATSALDNVTQAAVSNGIERLGITRIVVAHRLSTIRNADRIYFFNRGRIAEWGTYQGLMRHNGLFATFASRQTL